MKTVFISFIDGKPNNMLLCIGEQTVVADVVRMTVSANNIVNVITTQIVFLQAYNQTIIV